MNKYKVQWMRPKKKGFRALQEVVIYGEDNVLWFMNTYPFPKETTIDILPVL
jgi:hypothetical protein|tara:strand:+ start:318 stop:473 length:156 start_codon:yes stop_codon:yes gene_type:complete